MVVERALADAGFGGNGIDTDSANSLQIEQPVGGFENPLLHGRLFGCRRHCEILPCLKMRELRHLRQRSSVRGMFAEHSWVELDNIAGS